MELRREYGEDLKSMPEKIRKEIVELSSKGLEIFAMRVFDFFYTHINEIYLCDEVEKKLYQFIFWSRFFAFFKSTMNIVERLRREYECYKKFEDEHGENWPDILQEKFGDDWPEPDLSDIGETDFNKILDNLSKE
jgi:hypothetical protein